MWITMRILRFVTVAFVIIRFLFVGEILAQPDNIETFLKTQMQKRGIPGLQVTVAQKGKIVFSGAYGIANIEDSIPVTHKNVFPVHSITKAFTGVAIVQLSESGVLDLYSPISRYLDNLPETWRSVTVQQLLIHTSGIPDIWDGNSKMIADGEKAVWAKVQTLPMEFVPGDQFKYNQTNYFLLGKIIEKLTGKEFTAVIQEQQLNVADMPLTMFGDAHDIVPHIAGSYWYYRNEEGTMRYTGKLENYIRDWPKFIRTAVGINTSAEELVRWSIALQKGKFFKDQNSLQTLWTPGTLNNKSHGGPNSFLNGYALGWPTVLRDEHRAIASTGGARAALFIYPDDDLIIAVLTNLVGANPETFIDEVAGYFIPDMKAVNGFGLPPSIKVLRNELIEKGFENAIKVAKQLMKSDANFKLNENDLNAWGYTLIGQQKKKEGLEILKLTVALFPESWNAYDSVAEAYAATGDVKLAIKNYKQSLALNPQNTNAVEKLKKLQHN